MSGSHLPVAVSDDIRITMVSYGIGGSPVRLAPLEVHNEYLNRQLAA